MRIAALFCGLIAGLFALVAPAGLGTDLLAPFLKAWGGGPGQQLLGTVAWYAPPAAALLGGLLAFVAPGVGALILLGAGLGWVGMGIVDPDLFRIELLVPAALGLAGAMLAFLAGELELRQRRAARRNRREELLDNSDRREARPGPDRRESRDRDRDRDNIELRESEARAREAAFNMDPLTVPREDAPPRPAREIPLTLEDVVPGDPPEPPRRRAEPIWPEPGRRSVFDRRDPAPELTPRRSLFDRPATRVERPAAAPDRRERTWRDRERDYYDDEPAPKRNVFMWIAAVNGVVLIVLALVVGYMLVERAPAPASATVVADATDQTTVAAIPTLEAPAAAPVSAEAPVAEVDDRLTPNVWPALALPGSTPAEAPMLPMAATDQPMAATVGPAAASVAAVGSPAPAAGGINDPFAYCGAVKTIDYVDTRYTGPRFTADIADALRVPLQSAPDRVSWRCVDGVVYACASFDWPVCAMTPTAQEMLDYCQRNPGVTRLLAPNGTWSCEGNRPRIPDGASWPVDARGFFPNAWIPVLPPQRPTG